MESLGYPDRFPGVPGLEAFPEEPPVLLSSPLLGPTLAHIAQVQIQCGTKQVAILETGRLVMPEAVFCVRLLSKTLCERFSIRT